MGEGEKTVSVRIGPPRKSSADWLYPLRPGAGRKSGRLRFVTRRRFVKTDANGSVSTNSSARNGGDSAAESNGSPGSESS